MKTIFISTIYFKGVGTKFDLFGTFFFVVAHIVLLIIKKFLKKIVFGIFFKKGKINWCTL